MDSFYGGPVGQDFTIAYIFTSKNGATESLKSDLQRGWQSLISVGSIVAVSYGLPGDKATFDANKKKDIDVENKSYNSTLWRKEYEENGTNSDNGLVYTIDDAHGIRYRLIAAMTGNTPAIRVQANNNLNADATPTVTVVDENDPDSPLLEFSFPMQQLIKLGQVHLTGANGEVKVELDNQDINHPALNFWLPQSQEFSKVYVKVVKAGTPGVPSVEILEAPDEEAPEITASATELTPMLKFTLPQTPAFLDTNITSSPVDANVEPSVEPDLSDPDFPKIKFLLPKAQVMQSPTLDVQGPEVAPRVKLNSSKINEPFLEFILPRAVKFYYGTVLGAETGTGIEKTDESFVGYEPGDYYVDKNTGYIYLIKTVAETTVTFDFVACLQAPKPTVTVTPLDAFAEGAPNKPTVSQEADANGWKLTFGIPAPPTLQVDPDIEAAPSGEATAAIEVVDNTTAQLTFKIPRGSRLFSGELVDEEKLTETVEGAKPGDCYLNTKTGYIYILQEGDTWQRADGSLKGPVGDTLHIVRYYELQQEDDFDAGKNYIIGNYKDPITSAELFAVTFVNGDSRISYWYFITDDQKWSRVQLTGSSADLIETSYKESPQERPINSKTYSVDYINKLIGGEDDHETQERTAYSKQQVLDLLTWKEFSAVIESQGA